VIPAPQPAKTPVAREGIPRRVLVIDDEPLIRWALSVGLAGAGFDTVTASGGADARAAAAAWPRPDVILLDVHQADCSQLLADLRRAAPGCRVLMLGTCCDPAAEARWQGIEIIAKPFDLPDVIERVQRAANGIAASPA